MNRFFTALFSIRYLAVVAVVGPFIGAILMLLLGITDVINAYLIFFGVKPPEGAIEAGEAAMITLVALLDDFLFATILMIFGVGLYSLFFSGTRRGKSQSAHQKQMAWNHLKNLGGMDEMLLKVIIMLLSVSFLEFVLRAGMGALSWTTLVIPIAVVALGLCLRWMSVSADATEEIDLRRETMEAQPRPIHSTLGELERLAALREQGVLDEVEFGQMKEELLRT